MEKETPMSVQKLIIKKINGNLIFHFLHTHVLFLLLKLKNSNHKINLNWAELHIMYKFCKTYIPDFQNFSK